MSLNRSEQLVFDYLMSHKEERHHWQQKVRGTVTQAPQLADAVARIDSEFWRYYLERSVIEKNFAADVKAHGSKRISMKNLAEYLIRLWVEPKTKKPR